MTDSMLSRRRFMGHSTRAACATALGSMGLLGLNAPAHAAVSDYKALVCLFLDGGNDGTNMVVPLDDVRYSQYQRVRSASGLALSTSQLMPARQGPLMAASVSADQAFAFNAALAPLDRWYGQGKVGVMLNIGNLRRPLTKAEYLTGGRAPGELFSHPDQQNQAHAGLGAGASTGWGGRLMDVLGVARTLDAVSVGSAGLYVQGTSVLANLVPERDGLWLNGFSFWPPAEAEERRKALLKVLAVDTGHPLTRAANKALVDGMDLVKTLSTSTTVALSTTFPGTSLGAQLKTVAQLITTHARLGPGRQVYCVTLGGFDTHGGQAWQHADLMSKMAAAVDAFQTAMTGAALDRSVTLFTTSEFGRTFSPNSSGTDHGWGSTSLVVGGAVRGGLYGEFPDFTLGGPDDVSGRGAWIPRLGYQQLGATLGRWFGVNAAALSAQVFPGELDQFALKDLGFMG